MLYYVMLCYMEMILVFRKCANIQTFLQDEVSSVYYIHSDMSDATIPCIHISLWSLTNE